jgi:hypothetical protein
MIKTIKQILCSLELHNYDYFNKKVTYDIDNELKEFNTPIRECKWCGKKQHHMLPMRNGTHSNWKSFKWDYNSVVKMTSKF